MLGKIFTALSKVPILTRTIPLNENTGSLVVGLLGKMMTLRDSEKALIEQVVSGLATSTDSKTLYELVQNKDIQREIKELNSIFDSPNDIGAQLKKKFSLASIERFYKCESVEKSAICPHCGDII